MDFVSHILSGVAIAQCEKPHKRKAKWIITFAAFVPDIPVAVVYVLLGHSLNRPWWIPYNSDWIGIRESHLVWSALWEIPHSFLFLALVIVPIVWYFRLPLLAIVAYVSHLILDLFTHTGEWAIKPFYPISWKVEGFTDAWAWPVLYMALSWFGLLAIIVTIRWFCIHRSHILKGSNAKGRKNGQL
jgi:membrane-bound metal-dependent hydrolase YbcI (DUF457 family)